MTLGLQAMTCLIWFDSCWWTMPSGKLVIFTNLVFSSLVWSKLVKFNSDKKFPAPSKYDVYLEALWNQSACKINWSMFDVSVSWQIVSSAINDFSGKTPTRLHLRMHFCDFAFTWFPSSLIVINATDSASISILSLRKWFVQLNPLFSDFLN